MIEGPFHSDSVSLPDLFVCADWIYLLFVTGAYVGAGSSSNGTIFVWDVASGVLKAKLEGHTSGVCGFAWGRGGSSGQQVASVDRKGGLILWA